MYKTLGEPGRVLCAPLRGDGNLYIELNTIKDISHCSTKGDFQEVGNMPEAISIKNMPRILVVRTPFARASKKGV